MILMRAPSGIPRHWFPMQAPAPEVIARVRERQHSVGQAAVALGGLGIHLAVDRRGPREGPALQTPRRGAALLLRLELAEDPPLGVVLERPRDVEREVDAARRGLLGAHVAEHLFLVTTIPPQPGLSSSIESPQRLLPSSDRRDIETLYRHRSPSLRCSQTSRYRSPARHGLPPRRCAP
jgi:hypothetical protein